MNPPFAVRTWHYLRLTMVALVLGLIAAVLYEHAQTHCFQTSISAYWYGRGENATAKRRSELTKVAVTRIEERYRAALTTIEAKSAEVQTHILVGGLMSGEARAFVESVPSASELMPTITLPP